MSLVCVSCQLMRRNLIFSIRSTRCLPEIPLVSSNSLFAASSIAVKSLSHVNFHQTFSTSSYCQSKYPSNKFKTLLKDKLIPSESIKSLLSPARRNRRRFCTKVKANEKLHEGKEGGNDDSVSNRLISDSKDGLEHTLTKEELQVLKELEEEERKFREATSSQKDQEEDDFYLWEGDFDEQGAKKLSNSVSEGHVRFENRQRVIQDVIEEVWNPLPQQIQEEEEEPQIFPRGKTGVFDLGELVDLLRDENADELVAISLPKEIDYADYMVIVTVGNSKHLIALATFVRKRFKMKERKESDRLPVLDRSVNHKGWIALDLGNIILHIFQQETRDYYDLETLWTVGPLFDDLTNAKDPEIVQLLNSLK